MKGQTYVIAAIVLTIIIAVFAVINVDQVTVNYLFWSAESPLILVILFSVLMGGLITTIVSTVKFFRMQKEISKLNHENVKFREKLEQLGISPEELLHVRKKAEEKNSDE